MCFVFVDKGYVKKANSHQKSTTKNSRHHALAMLVHLTNFLCLLGAKLGVPQWVLRWLTI